MICAKNKRFLFIVKLVKEIFQLRERKKNVQIKKIKTTLHKLKKRFLNNGIIQNKIVNYNFTLEI